MKLSRAIVPFVAACALCSCTSNDDAAELAQTTSIAPISTVPAQLVAPAVPQGQPAIRLDPCLGFEDATLRAAGLNPDSRRRADTLGDVTSTLFCDIDGAGVRVSLISSNQTFDVARSGDHESRTALDLSPATDTVINGRDVFIGTNRLDDKACTVVLRTGFGFAAVDVSLTLAEERRGALDACAEATRIATALEPSLPKGN